MSEAEEDSKRKQEEKEALRGCGGCLSVAGILAFLMVSCAIILGSPEDDTPDAPLSPAVQRAVDAPEEIRPAPPAPQPPAGLGISRDSIVGLFRVVEIDIDFEESPLASGERRVIGQAEVMLVEITGPPDNIVSATVMFGQTTDPAQAIGIVAAVGILGIAIGDDPNNLLEWFGDTALEMAAGQERTYRANGNRARLTATEIGLYILSVEPDGP